MKVLGFVFLILLLVFMSSLFFWGLGNLIIWVFKINYTWTIWHGVVVTVIVMVLKSIFGK